MKSIKIDRILEAVAPRVYRDEWRLTHAGEPFVMPSFSDLAKLVERLKAEGSYDAENHFALFGVPHVFAALGEVPAYNYIVWNGRLEFPEDGEEDAPASGTYIWMMRGAETMEQALEWMEENVFTTLWVLDDGVYVPVLPRFTIQEEGIEKSVSAFTAYYTPDDADRPATERSVYLPFVCEVQRTAETYCFLAQGMDEIYEHLGLNPLCDNGQPTGAYTEKGVVLYEGQSYPFSLLWRDGLGWVELRNEDGLLYNEAHHQFDGTENSFPF